MTHTIDDAIAFYRRAITAVDRRLAREAIGQHIAAETAEDGDYESATDELCDRLDRERAPAEPKWGLFEDEACEVSIPDEAHLPDLFFRAKGLEVLRYVYLGQRMYEEQGREEQGREEQGDEDWVCLRTRTVEDDATAEEFIQQVAAG